MPKRKAKTWRTTKLTQQQAHAAWLACLDAYRNPNSNIPARHISALRRAIGKLHRAQL